MNSGSAPTSRDVAERAGVSRSIVSGVLNGSLSTMRVSAETRERILVAAAELGYTPNPAARALRRRRSNVLGFVPRAVRLTPYDSPVPFALSVELARASVRRGYHVVEASTESVQRHGTDDLVQYLVERHVDGIIVDSPDAPDEVERLVERGIPVVQMIRPQDVISTPSVAIDAVPGTTEAIAHLVAMGHRQVAFVGSNGQHIVDTSRLDAFRAVLAAHGIEIPPGWIVLSETYDPINGATAGAQLYSGESRPTAVFVAGDNLALGLLQHLYAIGVRIPEDVSVISYDDLFAAYLIPPLSSVSQPLRDAAEAAVDALVERIDHPDNPPEPRSILLPSHLVHRGSVAAPPDR